MDVWVTVSCEVNVLFRKKKTFYHLIETLYLKTGIFLFDLKRNFFFHLRNLGCIYVADPDILIIFACL